jgi:hypothetical protein
MRRGWWKLEISNIDDYNELKELSDCDREHIAKLIIEGCTEGEVLQEYTDEELENEEVRDTQLKELPLLLGSLEYDSSKEILTERIQNGEDNG